MNKNDEERGTLKYTALTTKYVERQHADSERVHNKIRNEQPSHPLTHRLE